MQSLFVAVLVPEMLVSLFMLNIISAFRQVHLWATVSKTVRLMLSDLCPVCPVCFSVTLMYCGQTIAWINVKLGMQVGLGLGHILLEGDPAPLP